EKGIEKGKKEGALQIAKNLLEAGMTLSQIVAITKLSENEINNLLKK
ncbi:MAG: hypothetical protein Q4G08_09910, partial [Capnocytophaga sp.]|nr:hypothetical protein [Capnocytophaga sp.]